MRNYPSRKRRGDLRVMEDPLERERFEAASRLEREEKQSVQGNLAIKGTRNGLLLTLEPETPFGELLKALADRLAEAPGFFRGASLSVDTSRRSLRKSERQQLEYLLSHYQMSVAPLVAVAVAAEVESGSGGRSTELFQSPLSPRPQPGQAAQEQEERETCDTLFLRRTVRSGQAIHHSGNIIVFGDVNPGSEIVAGGDVIVWGVLRGMVHAGYPENEHAMVCALILAPVQLRIAHLLSRPPETPHTQINPEVAAIRHGRIVVETWVNGRPPRK